jgi:hypothetical protein
MGEKSGFPYEGFTLGMAAVDTIPVLLFAAGGAAAAARLQSPLFALGVALSTAAGGCKAGWKYVLALRQRDLPLLQKLFRILMPAGFALMLLSIPFSRAAWGGLMRALLRMPALACLLSGCAGIGLMSWFAAKADSRSARANWAEQLTNIAAQGLFLLALLLAK